MLKHIVSDIEGTTTEITFVSEVLFPYFINHIHELTAIKQEPFYQDNLALIKETVLNEEQRSLSDVEALEQLIYWTKTDRKHPALKNLQGYIWKNGYATGALKAHVYPDVPACFEAWAKQNLALSIYSSGSVAAQKLLFEYSIYGDLRPFINQYFDTQIGHKREEKSYYNIAAALQCPANVIVFLSDIPQELDAAKEAGMHTVFLKRPGTEINSTHFTAADFKAVSTYINQLNGL